MDWELLRGASDRTAPTYDERFGPLQRDKYARALSQVALPEGALLDAGCGTGLLAEHTGRGGWTGVDLSAAMLVRAAARGVRTVQADLAYLPFADASFAGVVSFTSLIDLSRAGPALAELARVLRRDGLLLVTLLPHDVPSDWDDAATSAGLLEATRFDCGQDIGFAYRRVHVGLKAT